jgi:hypothetical protein
VLRQHFGAQVHIVKLERRPSVYRSSFALEEIEAHLDDGKILPLMFKDLSWQSLLDDARRVKSELLYHPTREIDTYRMILNPSGMSTALCYGSVVDAQADRYWLFLERIVGRELYKVGEFAIWQQAARWLAHTHGRFADKITESNLSASLLEYDETFYSSWMNRALAFLVDFATLKPHSEAWRIAWVAECYTQTVARLMELPVTFVHGEFYASNVLVSGNEDALRVCPVDWEMAGIAPGLIDLAALIAGSWSSDEKLALADAYYDALAPDANEIFPKHQFMVDLEHCQLYLAIRWMGSFGRRQPVSQHAQDWLSEAVRLCTQLYGRSET